MDRFISFIGKILNALIEFLRLALTGKPSHPSRLYPREQYKPTTEQQMPVSAPQEPQAELTIGSDIPPEYRISKSILTFRERILYQTLKKAVDGEFLIMAKVRMGDFVWLANEPLDRKHHNNQVFCKHVEFLLCTRIRLRPVLVIELDDPTHQLPWNEGRDKFKDETFASIGLPILRIKMQDKYDTAQLDSLIREKIQDTKYTEFDVQ